MWNSLSRRGHGSGAAWLTRSFQREPAHYFGYVYFRQVKDSSVKRGYFQKVSAWLPWAAATERQGLVAIGKD